MGQADLWQRHVTDLLLDTCAVIWIAAGARIDPGAVAAVQAAAEANRRIDISPITAWELGVLVSRGRMPARVSERVMLARILAQPGVNFAPMPADVLINSSYLPGNPPSDPADRIIIATAREYAMTVVTRDRLILRYAESGHLQALPC